MAMSRGSALKFELQAKGDSSRVTEVWRVTSNLNGSYLGNVGWYVPWRRYCFGPFGGSIFDAGCLQEILDFCKEETRKRKARATS